MFKLENCIKDITYYKYNEEMKNTINIGYGIDDNYARCMATSIVSFCVNNMDKNFTFHVMAYNFSNKTKINLKILAQNYHINIYIYEIDPLYLKEKLPTRKYLPIATYFRFILPIIIKNIDKIFYIDADIICLKNAQELFDIPIDNYIIGAVSDIKRMNVERNLALGLKEHVYFNAGVLAINIKKWNSFNTYSKVINCLIRNPEKFSFLDQDALNFVLTKRIKYLSNKFNCIDLNTIDNKKDIVLLHFAANPKPWHLAWSVNPQCNDFNAMLYQKYESLTPYKNECLILPRDYKEIEYYSKNLRKKGFYRKSFEWYIKYIVAKLKHN